MYKINVTYTRLHSSNRREAILSVVEHDEHLTPKVLVYHTAHSPVMSVVLSDSDYRGPIEEQISNIIQNTKAYIGILRREREESLKQEASKLPNDYTIEI